MDEMGESSGSEMPQAQISALQQFLEQWLAQAPADLAQTARYAALPHRFDLTLLSSLRGTTENSAALVVQLQRAGFVVAEESGQYALLPLLRDLLLRDWQSEDAQTYRRLSAQAADFYQSHPPGYGTDQIEYVYHLLGADDERGVAALSEVFEQAWDGRHLGLAEQLLRHAHEQKPVLGPGAKAWLDYFQARLDLAHRRYEQSEEVLRSLIADVPDTALKAQIWMSLAQIQVQTQRWTEALAYYTRAFNLYVELGDSLGAGRAGEARGTAYVHLASSLGGLSELVTNAASRYQTWLHYFLHAPFLLYRWFSRRIAYLPNLYFGSDYQDWIIIRLLYEAIYQFEQAAEQLAKFHLETETAIDDLATDIQIRRADLYHRVGQWAVASRLFEHLANAPVVRANDYRQAILLLGRGRAAMARSDFRSAQEQLEAAYQVFLRYEDNRTAADAARLLGNVQVADESDPTAAIFLYVQSIEAALAADDLLAATRVWYTLAAVQERVAPSAAIQTQVEALRQKLERRAYIARFPGTLLQRFRQLAAYVVLPLTYLLGPIVVIQSTLLFNVLETIYQATQVSALAMQIDLANGLIFILALVSLTIWMYEFLYVLAGWFVVRRMSLKRVAERLPEYVVTTPEGIAVRDERGQLQEMRWNGIKGYTTLGRALWHMPAALFSRLVLSSDRNVLVLDGIINCYCHLQQDIAGHLAKGTDSVKRKSLDFSLLDSPWTLIALSLTILLSIVQLSGWLDPDKELAIIGVALGDGNFYDLHVSSALYSFSLWALLFLPLVSLGRLLYNRHRARRLLGAHVSLGADLPLWLAFVLLSIWTLIWIWGLTA